MDQSVGRGWEIFRQRINGHSVDFYTKSGNWGVYASLLFLIPDYNFGFSILTASTNASGDIADNLPNTIIEHLLPALEEITKQQAHRNFAGHYTSDSVNSSVTIETDDWPALHVTQYIANDVDLLSSVFGGDEVDFRLVPNKIYSGRNVGFTAVYQMPTEPLPEGEFYWPCESWLDIDDFTYASVPLGNVVFEVDDSGRACKLHLKALRETLQRKQV